MAIRHLQLESQLSMWFTPHRVLFASGPWGEYNGGHVDWSVILQYVGAPVVTALGGFVGAGLSFKHQLETLKTSLETFKTSITKEVGEHKVDVEKKIVELKGQLAGIEDSYEKFARDSHQNFAKDEELTKFMDEVNRQWQQVQRTLGQIEGLMQVTARKNQ